MDFRLQVFAAVANRLSFTKAAGELYITQPAVSKHIQELEENYKIKLFDRRGSKISLTQAGEILLKYSRTIFETYRTIDYEMSTLTKERRGALRLGASTTISQYVISPLLADFHLKLNDIKVNLRNGNTEHIENALLNNEIEIGIVEGQSKNPSIKYIEFLRDEIVLVCKRNHFLADYNNISFDTLEKLKFVTREVGSGTLEVIEHSLNNQNKSLQKLSIEMQLGSTESIKSYLLNSDCVAFMSIHAVSKELKNNELRVIDVEDLAIERYFYIITLQGSQNALVNLFIKHLAEYYNLKL
ncbi:LysR family transcriptional regulator [Flavobacterium algicola]|uniref:LysR family transcriptional regulator n=1 Tax=Flavobacterium algicola TaxID=556529 RepID=UPI001EFC87DA|nr:LysR family transcriptional regulator [Flavobacterium algicola]MCG9792706.1 LysR family transcriptional regulator [Flavobacterium algicola]